MQQATPHKIKDNTFWLTPERCIYWEEQQVLILSDLHFGKTGHFRKAGIGVPQSVFKEDLQRLFTLIQFYKPTQLIIVGDMFHSVANKEMELFTRWRNDLPATRFQLIKGNHDILNNNFYTAAGIEIMDGCLQTHGFGFIHDPSAICNEPANNDYFFTGHIHPGVRINSGSRQTLSFPCYYFGKEFAILPAYSKFSGYVPVKPKRGDTVYAIVNQSLVKLK